MKENVTNTDFGEKLVDAIDANKKDINSLVWKYQNGVEAKLIEMPSDELQRCYNHCTDMLYNKSKHIPGKYEVRKNIQKLYRNCNAELFLRYIIHETNIDSLKTNKDVFDVVTEFRKNHEVDLNESVAQIFNNVPNVYNSVTVSELFEACFDKLDVLNKKLISDKFILAQGIWLTDEEKKELTEYDEDGNLRNRLDVMKERLFLDNVRLRIDSKGFSYAEFRSLIQLPPLPKISSLPTVTLKLLRDKILLLLDNDLNYHIDKWTNLMHNIELVAKTNGFTLTKKEY